MGASFTSNSVWWAAMAHAMRATTFEWRRVSMERTHCARLVQIIFSDLPGQVLLDLGDLLVEVLEMGMQSLQHLYQPCWQALFCQHGRQAFDSFLGVTKRMAGRLAASQMASASMKSFLLLLTKGARTAARSAWPHGQSRPMQCAPAQASTTMVRG